MLIAPPFSDALAAIQFREEPGTDVVTRIEIRFTSADSGFELELEIAASGGPSAGPVLPAHSSPNGRFVETSRVVIDHVLENRSAGVKINFLDSLARSGNPKLRQKICLHDRNPDGVILSPDDRAVKTGAKHDQDRCESRYPGKIVRDSSPSLRMTNFGDL